MSFADPCVAAGVAGLPALFRGGQVSPTDVAEAYLARIERFNSQLGAFLTLDADGARRAAAASARRWREERPLSPVDGAPIGVKANVAVAGLPWHAGIGAYRDRIAPGDAEVVARLRAAGAVILGVVNMHEAALGATTDNLVFGRCHNPYRQGFTPGGSSGGSGAAVAAGLCAAALGTDTMGSVRIPSAYCGVFGHKPGRGTISTQGVVALSWSLDHVGVHARSAEDCALMLAASSSAAAGLSAGAGLMEGRIGVLDFEGQVDVEPPVAQAFEACVERARALGLSVEPVRLDYDFGAMRRLGLLLSEAEGFAEHQLALSADPDGFSPGLRQLLDWGAHQPAWRLASAYRDVARTAERIRARLAAYVAVLAPTTPQTAFAFEAAVPASQADFTALADFMGAPASAFPVGVSHAGLPLSVQAMAPCDEVALGLAARLAQPIAAPPAFSA